MEKKYYIEKKVINWKPIVVLGGTFIWILLSETTTLPLSAFYMLIAFFMFWIFVQFLDEEDFPWKKKKVWVKQQRLKNETDNIQSDE